MRTTCSSSKTKILPSPIFPVLAAFSIASMTRSSMSLLIAASIFTFGRKSTTYSAPRYSSVWPFCLPKPLTSVTVMPCTPMADRASRTSSSLNGLMIAVTSFMELLPPSKVKVEWIRALELVQALQREGHQALAAHAGEVCKHRGVTRGIPAHFGAHFEVVSCQVCTGYGHFLKFLASNTEVQAVLVVEGLVPQNAAVLRREHVGAVERHAVVLLLGEGDILLTDVQIFHAHAERIADGVRRDNVKAVSFAGVRTGNAESGHVLLARIIRDGDGQRFDGVERRAELDRLGSVRVGELIPAVV